MQSQRISPKAPIGQSVSSIQPLCKTQVLQDTSVIVYVDDLTTFFTLLQSLGGKQSDKSEADVVECSESPSSCLNKQFSGHKLQPDLPQGARYFVHLVCDNNVDVQPLHRPHAALASSNKPFMQMDTRTQHRSAVVRAEFKWPLPAFSLNLLPHLLECSILMEQGV